MKKILFIIISFSAGGGAEALLTTIVNHLNPNKYEIGIMEIVHHGVKVEPINENIKIYPYFVRADDPQRKAKMYYIYHEWDQVIADYIPQGYDLYIAFNFLKPTFLLPPGKKNIAWIHGVRDLLSENNKEEWELQNKAFYKAQRIVAISDITTEKLRDFFPEHKDKLQTIYNGLDIEKVREMAKSPTEIYLEHPSILSVGRLDENKNPLRLLDIFEQVHQINSQVHLYYLGYGALKDVVVSVAKEKGLSQYVHLLGYHNNPFPIMAQCDVVGMFSLSEGFPMALLESIALDRPFVSSIIGGARTLANEQRCGKTVESDQEATNAIIKYLQTERISLQNECRESIKRFELRTYIRQIEELFDELLKM